MLQPKRLLFYIDEIRDTIKQFRFGDRNFKHFRSPL